MKNKYLVSALVFAFIVNLTPTNINAAEPAKPKLSSRVSSLPDRSPGVQPPAFGSRAAAPVTSTATAQPTSYDKATLLAAAADKGLAEDFIAKAFEGVFEASMTSDGRIQLSQAGKPTIIMEVPQGKLSPVRIGKGGITAKGAWVNGMGLRLRFYAPGGTAVIHNEMDGNHIYFATNEELSLAKDSAKKPGGLAAK